MHMTAALMVVATKRDNYHGIRNDCFEILTHGVVDGTRNRQAEDHEPNCWDYCGMRASVNRP